MATTAPLVPQPSRATPVEPSKIASVKVVAESPDLKSVPSLYVYSTDPNEQTASDPEDSIPVIDYSLLTSGTPDERAKVIQDLGKACEEWGFFMLVNHGVPETLVKSMMDVCKEFFNSPNEEKPEFERKHEIVPIRWGTGTHNATQNKFFFWRDFFNAIVHPEFHSPNKPVGFSELSLEYSKRTRKVARELLRGISESLGVGESYMDKALNLDSAFQLLGVNFYPPCPQPEQAIGLPPHTDYGLLSLVMQNGVRGLQQYHNGKWVTVNAIPNAIIVDTADQLEIFTNGKYKAAFHRAVVNDNTTRITIVMANGPSMDTVVSPDSNFVDNESHPPDYIPMKFKDYLDLCQNKVDPSKQNLDRVRVQRE